MSDTRTVSWDSSNNTLTVGSDVVVTAAETITWVKGTSINSITLVQIGDDWPYSQPSGPAGDGSWSVFDQDSEGGTVSYKYTVAANVAGVGVRTLDPRIEDEPPPFANTGGRY